jgi:hypothetical protein
VLALHATAANAQDRDQVVELAEAGQAVIGNSLEVAFVDQATAGRSRLEVVKLPETKRGFVLLPRRWVIERNFAWLARFRLARDYERLQTTLEGLRNVAFALLALNAVRPLDVL